MIGSDGLPHDTHPHPRLWGTFPRVLGHYSREEKLFPLEEAVRRMTGLPAQQFRLSNRGRIAVGAYADLTIFDPATVIDRATFEAPMTPAAGILGVLCQRRTGLVRWPARADAPAELYAGPGPDRPWLFAAKPWYKSLILICSRQIRCFATTFG